MSRKANLIWIVLTVGFSALAVYFALLVTAGVVERLALVFVALLPFALVLFMALRHVIRAP